MTKAIEEVYSSLKGQFRGDLIRPGDDDYETARGIWNAMVARRPGLIARCAEVPDIQSAVSAASTIGVVTACVAVDIAWPASAVVPTAWSLNFQECARSPLTAMLVEPALRGVACSAR